MAGMSGAREALQPIFTTHLFPKLEAKLMELLRSLALADWEKQTLAPKWKVKDVAAHLLDTQIRKLAAARRSIFTIGISPEESRTQVQVTGDESVGLHILNMISIVG